MANLQALRQRINSIKGTKKITSAMKLVATSHFKKLQKNYDETRNYARALSEMLNQVIEHKELQDDLPALLQNHTPSKHLIIVLGSDRGLCGGFNLNVAKEALAYEKQRKEECQFLCLGTKAFSALPQEARERVIKTLPMKAKSSYSEILNLSFSIENLISTKQFSGCSVIYSHFKSVICSLVKTHTLVPYATPLTGLECDEEKPKKPLFDVEPNATELLKVLAFKTLAAQLYFACIESRTSEQSSRMMAMDNSTRNAEDILEKLELTYHRSRQAAITRELIEIVAGAESL